MRLELIFELKEKKLPKDNKSIWISFMKSVLTRCNNGDFYKRYYSDAEFKDYSYSVIYQKPKFIDEDMYLEGNIVRLIFSASDRLNTGLIFFSAFLASKYRTFPLPDGNSMVLKSVRKITEQMITCSDILIRTVVGGGIIVREHDRVKNTDVYYTFKDSNFEENLKGVLKRQAVAACFEAYLVDEMEIQPVDCRKVVVKLYGAYVDATIGTIRLHGNPKLLQYFYQAGLGSRSSMGFGLIDVIAQDVI